MSVADGSVEERLVGALAMAARGPTRNGIFAVWLFAHVAAGALPPHPLALRTHRRRLEQMQRRLSSLSIPPPLRRALTSAMRQLADGTAAGTAAALDQLVEPARVTIGPDAADALAIAAAGARAAAATTEER